MTSALTLSLIHISFDTLEELADFYLKATEYVQNTLAEGWKKKDAFDLSLYQ